MPRIDKADGPRERSSNQQAFANSENHARGKNRGECDRRAGRYHAGDDLDQARGKRTGAAQPHGEVRPPPIAQAASKLSRRQRRE